MPLAGSLPLRAPVHLLNIQHLLGNLQNTYLFIQNHFCVYALEDIYKNITVAPDVWKRIITVEFLVFLKALSLKYGWFDFITAT